MPADADIFTADRLVDAGWSERDIRRAVASGDLARIRRGVFARGEAWRSQYVEGRQRARARAAVAASDPGVFSHHTAAAVHGLPLFRVGEERIHTTLATTKAPTTATVVRHIAPLDDGEVATVGGLRVTSLTRTLLDMLRLLPAEAGTALADAALRRAEAEERGGADRLRERVGRRLASAAGARGIRRARTVWAFADPRSASPGESGSRWFLRVIGFRDVALQVEFPGPDGGSLWVDFGFRGGGLGEFDGADKYRNPEFLRGRTPQQAVIDEKRREDWLRGLSGGPFARWMDADMPDAAALARRLAAFGIRP